MTAPRGLAAPLGLIALGLVPLTAGSLRLLQLGGGPDLLPADPRFGAATVAPLVTHIVGSLVFVLAGAAQFVPRLRRRGNAWHRRAGRVVAVAGLLVALSATWMTLFYPPKAGTGDLLYVLRLVFAPAMAACIGLGVGAIRRRDSRAHRAWMVRAYAIGLAAGTQVITEGFGRAIVGSGVLEGDVAKGLGWVINIGVAEWVIRRPGRRRVARARAVGAHA